MRVKICDIEIDSYSCDQVVDVISHQAQAGKPPEYIVTPNAQHIVLLQNDQRFREVYRDAFLSVPDGVPLLWAAQFLKTPLSGRVNGTDLFEKLCEVAAQKGLKVFLLGGRPGVADKTKWVLQQRHAQLNVVGTYCPPYGFESDSTELERINHAIQLVAPHLLFVALGAPKQELWIYNNYQSLGVPVSLGIGASFEFVSGVVPRAPKLMQALGLEWFFRLAMEPRRLWKRYVVCNTLFVWLVLQQRLGVFALKQNA